MANLKVTENPVAFMPFTEHVDPSNPAAGGQRLFVDTDHLLKMVDSSGTVTTFATGGGMATDTLWDAAGDLAVGTGANTGAKLTKGAAGANLSTYNGTVAWNGGTSFPASPTTGDRYWRSDKGLEFYYDGTRWLTTHVFTLVMVPNAGTGTTTVGDVKSNISATSSSIIRVAVPSVLGCSDIYLVDYQITFNVQAGTALSASHKWVGTTIGIDSASASTGTVVTTTIDSGSSSVFRTGNTTIGAVRVSGTLLYATTWTKTGTPGTLVTGEILSYRIIAT